MHSRYNTLIGMAVALFISVSVRVPAGETPASSKYENCYSKSITKDLQLSILKAHAVETALLPKELRPELEVPVELPKYFVPMSIELSPRGATGYLMWSGTIYTEDPDASGKWKVLDAKLVKGGIAMAILDDTYEIIVCRTSLNSELKLDFLGGWSDLAAPPGIPANAEVSCGLLYDGTKDQLIVEVTEQFSDAEQKKMTTFRQVGKDFKFIADQK